MGINLTIILEAEKKAQCDDNDNIFAGNNKLKNPFIASETVGDVISISLSFFKASELSVKEGTTRDNSQNSDLWQ